MIAKGLLITPEKILNQTMSYYDGNPDLVTSSSINKVDAKLGVFSLIVGFSVQILGYFIQARELFLHEYSLVVSFGIVLSGPIIMLIFWRISQPYYVRAEVLKAINLLSDKNQKETILIRCMVLQGRKLDSLKGDLKLRELESHFGKKRLHKYFN